METCRGCRFFLQQGAGGGICRRHAQQVITTTDRNRLTGEPIVNAMFDWPAVANEQWCGDFEAARTEEPDNG